MLGLTSNAVNLTDGLDGLAIGCTIIAAGALAVLTYVSGHVVFADYLELQRMPMVGELTIFCGSMVGASIGFLWYNAHPAEIFMGDVGSLALGGAIGTVAIIIRQELLLPFIGGIFILEALSVILQVGSYKLRNGKRIFKMAPLHHHFEQTRLERVQSHCPLLDRRTGVCTVCTHHSQIALENFRAAAGPVHNQKYRQRGRDRESHYQGRIQASWDHPSRQAKSSRSDRFHRRSQDRRGHRRGSEHWPRSVHLLRDGGYRGRIVSFEPIASAFQTLSSKAAADANWEAHHCGLGAAPGVAALHVSELSVFSSILNMTTVASLHDSRMAVDHIEEVPIQTLDQVAAGLSGRMLLKIDTQGYERQVIEGGPRTIPRVLGILMELPIIHVYDGEWQFHEALRFMAEAGFVPAQIQPVNYHGMDNVSAVEFDCLFRPLGQADGPLSAERR